MHFFFKNNNIVTFHFVNIKLEVSMMITKYDTYYDTINVIYNIQALY